MPTASELATSVADFIADMQTQASTAVTALSNAAADWSTASWDGITSPTLVSGHAAFADDDATVKTALGAYKTALANLTFPGTLPTPPDLTTFVASKWDEADWTALKALLTEFTGNIGGSDDVDTVVAKLTSDTTKLQVALLAADREHKQQALRDAFSAAEAATGADGFTYPNCMTTALKLAAQQQFMFDLSQTCRTLIEKLLDWAKNNFQFAVQQGISAHNSDVDFNIRYAAVLVDSYETSVKVQLGIFKEQIEAIVAQLDADVKAYSLRLEAFKANAAVDSEYDRNLLVKYDADVKQMHSDVLLTIETNKSNSINKITAYKASADAAARMAGSTAQVVLGKL